MTHCILFLDIDGVLNGREPHPVTGYCTINKECVNRLESILEDTNAQIVLSSSWRYLVHGGSMTLDGLRYLLNTHHINGSRLIGITKQDEHGGTNERGKQIQDWITENNYTGRYLVLDDMDLGISDFEHPLLITDGKVGLTDSDAELAIALLTSTPIRSPNET